MKIPVVLLLVCTIFAIEVNGSDLNCVQCEGAQCDGNPEPTPCDKDVCAAIKFPIESTGLGTGKYCWAKDEAVDFCKYAERILKSGKHGVCFVCGKSGCNLTYKPPEDAIYKFQQ